ncbi:MAG: glycosyltransferase family 4 protein [bacterium]
MRKVVFITDIPTYHKIPLFNSLTKIMHTNGFGLKVFFLASGEKRRKWELNYGNVSFVYEILGALKVNLSYEWTMFVPISLIGRLNHERPDIIITGGFSLATICVLAYCKYKRIPYVIWSGEIPNSSSSQSIYRKKIREILIRHANSIIVYGSRAASYIKLLNINKPVFTAYNTSDICFFSEVAINIRRNRKKFLGSLGLSPVNVNIIYVGGLVRRKGVQFIIKALASLKEQYDFTLHIIGNGVEKDNLQKQVVSMQLENNVCFWGHKDKTELAKYYGIGDIFVFPTLHDVWGLVLNEAMAAGLPVIASKFAGATYDLIENGNNGFIVDPSDISEMQSKIKMLLNNHRLRKRMGENAQKTIISKYTAQNTALVFLDCLSYAIRAQT